MSGGVRLVGHGAVAEVVLAHGGKLNAMSRAMWGELSRVFAAIAGDERLRAVVLRGEGGPFCAGGDIAEYPSFRFDAQELARFHEEEVWGGLMAVWRCPLPVIAAIEGPCMGAGLELACCSDLRVASRSARFGAPIARLGFPMAPREAALLVQVLGASTARLFLVAAEVRDASALAPQGFVHRLVEDGQAAEVALQWAQELANLSPLAVRLSKSTLRALAEGASPSELARAAYDYANDPQHREGIRAFLDKRQPVF